MECTRWNKNQQAYLEVIWKENKTDDVICLHFGVYGNICGHMIPSSVIRESTLYQTVEIKLTLYIGVYLDYIWLSEKIQHMCKSVYKLVYISYVGPGCNVSNH